MTTNRSPFGDDHRDAAGAGEYVSVSHGDTMRFRLLAVGRVYINDRFDNKPECTELRVRLLHMDAAESARDRNPGEYTWDPISKNIDGMIKLSDRLDKEHGRAGVIHDVDIEVTVTKHKSPSSQYYYHKHEYKALGQPQRQAFGNDQRAAAGTNAADESDDLPRGPFIGEAKTYEQATAIGRKLYAQAKADGKNPAAIIVAVARRKLAIFGQWMDAATSQDDVNAAWEGLQPHLGGVDAETKSLMEARHNTAKNAKPTSDDPFDIAMGVKDDDPFANQF